VQRKLESSLHRDAKKPDRSLPWNHGVIQTLALLDPWSSASIRVNFVSKKSQ
jgi:hypothetical protein